MHAAFADGTLAALVDKGQLETVLLNLATNARDAMPGGGTLTFRAAAETVEGGHAAGLTPGQYVRLTVVDTGMGMDPATLARVTEPFFTTKPAGKGTGLGLSMAKGFAEQSHGALAIASNPGEGTTVTLWLPKTDLRSTLPDKVSADHPQRTGSARARLLVVDDDPVVRAALAEDLDGEYCVATAASGAEALSVLYSGEAVDALVTDLTMPGMDGLSLIREAQTRCPGLPAVLLTGFAGDVAQLAVSGVTSGNVLTAAEADHGSATQRTDCGSPGITNRGRSYKAGDDSRCRGKPSMKDAHPSIARRRTSLCRAVLGARFSSARMAPPVWSRAVPVSGRAGRGP